jgi:hypothetical protein
VDVLLGHVLEFAQEGGAFEGDGAELGLDDVEDPLAEGVLLGLPLVFLRHARLVRQVAALRGHALVEVVEQVDGLLGALGRDIVEQLLAHVGRALEERDAVDLDRGAPGSMGATGGGFTLVEGPVPIIEAPYLLVISPSPELSAAANSASPARWTSAVGAAGLNVTAGMDRGAGATPGPGVRATGAEPPADVRDADLADGGLGGAGCAGAAAASAERAGARVAASVTWNELNQAVHVHGLATTGGLSRPPVSPALPSAEAWAGSWASTRDSPYIKHASRATP